MDVTKNFEKLEHSAVKLTITVKKDDVSAEYKDLLKSYAKEAKIDGYRVGKVPTSVLERKFGESIRMETMGKVMDKAAEAAFDGEKLAPLAYSQPSLEGEPDFKIDQDFSFTIKYDVYPEVPSVDIAGKEITVPSCKVTQADEDKELADIRDRNALVIDKADDALAVKGDNVTIDYWEIDEEGKEVANTKRENFAYELGVGYNIYDLDDAITGMKVGESKVVDKTYAADYRYNELAGKTKKIGVKLGKLKEKKLPELDDELAQDVSEKFKTLADLKADIKTRLEKSVEEKIKQLTEQAIIDSLLEKAVIDMPETMVNAELDMRLQNLMQRMGIQDVNQFLQILASGGKSVDSIKEEWRPDTEKSIKTRLILDKLIEDGKYEASEDEVKAELEKIATESNVEVDEVKAEYTERGMMGYLNDRIKEDKLFADLLKKVTVKAGKDTPMADLFSIGGADL